MSQLTSGLNLVTKYAAVPSNGVDAGVRPNTGETSVFIWDKNIVVYVSANAGTTWATASATWSTTVDEGGRIEWSSSVNRVYVKDVGNSAGTTRMYPGYGSSGIPALAAYTSSIEDLADVPDYDSDEAGQYLKVNSGGTALEFAAVSGGTTYSTSAEFVLNYAEVDATASGSLALTDTNAKNGSSVYYTYDAPSGIESGQAYKIGTVGSYNWSSVGGPGSPSVGNTFTATSSDSAFPASTGSVAVITGAEISIPADSRVVGMVWRIVDPFITSSGNASLNGLVSFGDEGIYFPISGGYNYLSYPYAASSISSGTIYKITTVGTYDWSSRGGPSSPSVGDIFTATSNDYSNFPGSTGSVAKGQTTSFNFENGASSNVFNLGDGDDLKMVSGGMSHAPALSGAFIPKVHWKIGYSGAALTGGIIGIKFIYI